MWIGIPGGAGGEGPCSPAGLAAARSHQSQLSELTARFKRQGFAYQHQKKVDLSYLFLGWAEKSLYSHGYQKTCAVWVKDPTSLLAVSVPHFVSSVITLQLVAEGVVKVAPTVCSMPLSPC